MIQYDHPVKVYYKDVDQMGIVYYSRYFEYFEEASTELLNSIGLDVKSIENEGIQLPVIESHCEYSKGAKFEQDLIIKTTILDIPKARLKIDYNVYKDHSNELLVKGYTVHAFMNQSGRAIKIPGLLLNTIQDNM